MQVNSIIFRIIQLFILLLIVALIGTVVVFLLRSNPSATVKDTGYEAVTLRLQTSAFSYHRKLEYYSGVCSDIGVPDSHVCRESESGFLIYTRLTSGSLYCADSTGFIGMVRSITGSALQCQP